MAFQSRIAAKAPPLVMEARRKEKKEGEKERKDQMGMDVKLLW